MRVLLLCAATFAGGLLAGAVFWPASVPVARRTTTTDATREALEASARERGPGAALETGSEGASGAARAPTTPLRELAGEASADVARALEGPAARAAIAGDGTISGNVRDQGGEPVSGVVVTATPEAQPPELTAAGRRARERAHEDVDLGVVARDAIASELWRRESRRTARTDAQGRYEIEGLPEGWHRVTAFAEAYDVRAQNNRVQPDAVVDFLAQPVRVVPVEVRLSTDELAEYAWVSWQGPQGSGSDAWQPDPGTVRLPGAPCKVRAQTWFPEPLQSQETDYDAATASGPLVLKLEGRRMLVARLVPAEGLSVPEGVEFRLRRVEGGTDVDPASLKDDQVRTGSVQQGRATWYDLEAGRYLIAAFLGGRYLLAHAVAEMGEGSTEIGLPFESPPAGTYVTAKVVGPEGGPALGNARFTVVSGPAGRARHDLADALRRVDGTWLVLLPEQLPADAADAQLRVSVGSYGTAQEPFDPRRPGSVTIRFKEPSRLRIVVERFAGSGVEGRLFAALWGEEGTVSTRQVEADGRCDLGAIQPRDYTILLIVRDRDSRWTIFTRKIALRGGEEEEKVAVPALHTLRVRPSPQLRAGEVTLQSTDPAIGWMRRTARVEGEVATFDALAAAAYEIRCGNKRVDARVPGPDEVRVE